MYTNIPASWQAVACSSQAAGAGTLGTERDRGLARKEAVSHSFLLEIYNL